MNAFEITIDDLKIVLKNLNVQLTREAIEDLFSSLDFEEIEYSALTKINLDEQTNAAFKEIEKQVLIRIKNNI